jgi:general secretion pathway protein J
MRRPSGFTLIEAMVSIVILAIIATLLWQGFVQTARNKEIVEREADRLHEIASALDRMQRELSMAFVSSQLNDNPSLQLVRTGFVGTDRSRGDRIDFTSFSHQRLFRDAHESDQNEISYFVTRHPDEPQIRVLARREQNRVDQDPQKDGRVQILVEDVVEFELEYFDPVSSEWQREWDSTQFTAQPNRLPTQVKITLTVPNLRNPDREQVFGTRATIPLLWGLNHATYRP